MQESFEKNPAAVAMGRLGGLKGGNARAAKLTPEQRSMIAKRAAMKRWHKNDVSKTVEENKNWQAIIFALNATFKITGLIKLTSKELEELFLAGDIIKKYANDPRFNNAVKK